MSTRFSRARAALVAATMIVALMVPLTSVGHAQALWFATWEVNVAKSRYPLGPPAFKRMTCRIEPWEEHVRVTYEIVGTRGGITHIEWIGEFDGRDYPVAGIEGYVVTHAYRRVDERTYDVIQKTEGASDLTARLVISADGKTLTTVTPSPSVRDPADATVTVYDRR